MLFKSIKYIVKSFAEILSPRNCEVCSSHLGNRKRRFEFICDKCFDAIPLAPEPAEIYNNLIASYDNDDLAISSVLSLFSIKEDHQYMNLIYSLKYYGFDRIGIELGKELGRLIKYTGSTNYDALIPIPIHHARMRERGYNQSDQIAIGISSIIEIPIDNKIVKRKINTQTQTLLSKDNRRKNVLDAFELINEKINLTNKSFLIIDDVLTTGSTINACANTVLEAGAKRIDAATLVYS